MFKILIVGCGRISPKHIESIKKLNKIFKLVGICDINKKKIIKLSKSLKVPGFENIKEAIKQSNPDLVSILTPSGFHAKHAIEVLNLKRHVVIEKPMCLTLKDSDTIIKLSKKFGKKTFVVMQNKFNLPVEKLIKDISQKKFGKIFHASVIVRWRRDQKYYNQAKWRGTWALDGGVISNQASHHIDLMRRIMGNPTEVYAVAKKYLSKIECEDTALVIVKFKNNKTGLIEATTAMRPKDIEGSISIMGTKGSAKIGGFALNKMDYYNLSKNLNLERYKTNPKNVYGFGHVKFYKHVYGVLKKNLTSEFDAKKSSETVKFLNMIYRSIETKKKVYSNKIINSKKLGKFR